MKRPQCCRQTALDAECYALEQAAQSLEWVAKRTKTAVVADLLRRAAEMNRAAAAEVLRLGKPYWERIDEAIHSN